MSTDAYQLSPLQQGMLFHWILDRYSGIDIEQIVGDLHEIIEPARLERGWHHAVAAFSTLRTAFRWEGVATPLQHVESSAECPFAFEDLRPLGSADQERHVAEYLRSDRHNGFDLTHAPAMRVALFRLEDSRFRMVWSFHHILIDGRAFEVILKRVFADYEGAEAHPVVDRPYRDYVDWVVRQDSPATRDFWRAKLKGFTAPTPIPLEHAVTLGQDRFGQKGTQLSVDVTQRLRDLASREALSLNTVVMGAWALLLWRYTGERDIVFGATKTTRRGTIADADAMVGLFLATIPVRIAVDPSLPAAAWLRRVREEWVSLRGYEHLPLVDIRHESELPPSASLCDTLVVFDNYQFGTRLHAQGGRWAGRHFRILEQTSFPLSLLAYGDEALALKIEFDARRFDESTIDRMVGHITTVLGAWAEDASRPLWRTPMLTASERNTILVEWNDTACPYPRETPLAALIEAQADRMPDAPAVTYGAETITYRQLNARANQLARELRKCGAGPDSLVGLAVERSTEMMVALLAVVKSGAAYVPLDPMFPRDRLAYMMSDSALGVLVTQTGVRRTLPPFAGAVLEVDAPTWQAQDAGNLGVAVGSASLAYVIYTSGSTGRPKGVQVTRGALTNLLWSMREWLDLKPRDRLLAVTTISFDIAGVDVWLPWLVGAETVVASREAAADGAQLRALIEGHDITLLQATPVTWHLLLEAGWSGKPDLRIVCTGEAMPAELASQLPPLVARVWNLYGPTETTIWSTGVVVREPTEQVSIGRPIANTRCYILDEHREPVPVGVTGELYIAGDGLARGYLKRPDLTEEKFVPDPFAGDSTARAYRTGDLARFRADGTIECLGRTDHQVKIRGFRIELGEIESVLKLYPNVKQAVVVAREDVPGEKQLVGYVVPHSGLLDVAALRDHMKQSLPVYMVPAAIVSLDAIPLTANGKIDRRALPAVDRANAFLEGVSVSARTHVEHQLCEIWEELFGLRQVGVTQDFFDLGGHSILAVKLMAKIRRVFAKQVALNALFEAPTIAQLAKHIEDSDRTLGPHTLVSIRATGSRPPIFWIPGGAALGLFRLHDIVTGLDPEQPVYGLGSTHPESIGAVETVEQRAKSYLELLRRVQPLGPYCFMGFCAGGYVAFEMAQQLLALGETVAFVGMINCVFPEYPFGAVDRLLLKVQRLRRQIQVARAGGTTPIGYVRQKVEEYRKAAVERRELEAAARQVGQIGFRPDDDQHNQVLLDATVEVFLRYQPRYYPGRVSLFMSDDDGFVGVSRRLDARFEWARHAAAHEIRTFPGGHDIDPSQVGAFAEGLKAMLDEALLRVSHRAQVAND